MKATVVCTSCHGSQHASWNKCFVLSCRFGLGWNSVYHFTDVPSFCSGDNIVLFDPHAKWVLHACRASM
jgi:hypothetical protein